MRRLWLFSAFASVAVACGTSDVSVGDEGDASADGGVDASSDGHEGDAACGPCGCGFCAPDAHADAKADAQSLDGGADASSDAHADVASDAGIDAGTDAGVDTGIDAALDAGIDAAIDAGIDAAIDAGVDTGTDAARDTGIDTGVDAGIDSGFDAGIDAPADAPFDGPVFVDGGACNTLVNGGAAVPETQVPLATPSSTGGSIALGTYYLTRWESYTGVGGAVGPTGNTRKTAFFFQPTLYMKVTADNGLGDENDNRTWSTQGTTLTSNQFCPTNDFLTSDYSVSGNVLVLVGGTTVLTFLKQ